MIYKTEAAHARERFIAARRCNDWSAAWAAFSWLHERFVDEAQRQDEETKRWGAEAERLAKGVKSSW
jgi:hypothetical protein